MQKLLPQIRETMWNGRLPPNYNWETASLAAIEAEQILYAKQRLNQQNQSINAVLPQITNHEMIIKQQQNRLDEMEALLKNLSLTNTGSTDGPNAQLTAISNYFSRNQDNSNPHNNYDHHRPRSRGRENNYKDNYVSRDKSFDKSSYQRNRSRSREYRDNKYYDKRYYNDLQF